MSLRWKFSLIAAALAAFAALAASSVGYVATRSQLLDQIDNSVSDRAMALGRVAGDQADLGGPGSDDAADLSGSPMPGLPQRRGFPPPPDDQAHARLFVAQQIHRSGKPVALDGVVLPVDSADLALANAASPARIRLRDSNLPRGGEAVRIATVAIPGVGAIQVARSLKETSQTLSDLRTRLLLITLLVIAFAIAVAFLLARTATKSLEHLTQAAENVARSGSPDAEIQVAGSDEIGRLGRSLSQMLASLAQSQEQQQRFVQDAGHELRTPLTSLRTNISVLDRLDRLGADDRARLIADLESESTEMATLVDELVQLSIGGDEQVSSVDLARLGQRAAERAQRRSGRVIETEIDAATIDGRPRGLERAVSNLLDNAIKFDSSGGPIELKVSQHRIEVSDRGPGIPKDQLELVFERFHRTIESRNVPGSGLGLSIVSDVAEAHGGKSYARQREGGGATVGFTLSASSRSR